MGSFGTTDPDAIWQQLGRHSDIYSIDVDGVTATFDYAWSDPDHDARQIANLQRKEHGLD